MLELYRELQVKIGSDVFFSNTAVSSSHSRKVENDNIVVHKKSATYPLPCHGSKNKSTQTSTMLCSPSSQDKNEVKTGTSISSPTHTLLRLSPPRIKSGAGLLRRGGEQSAVTKTIE